MIDFKESIARGIGGIEFNSGKINNIVIESPRRLVSASRETFDLNYKVPESYLHVYEQIRTVHFMWELSEGSDTQNAIMNNPVVQKDLLEKQGLTTFSEIKQWISGGIQIPSFSEAFSMEANSNKGYYVTAQYLGLNPNSFIPIDIGPSLTAYLKLENNELIDRIIIIDDAALEVYDMEISLEKYFELAIACKLFTNWQTAYIFQEKANNYMLLKEVLPLIFPVDTLDLSAFGID